MKNSNKRVMHNEQIILIRPKPLTKNLGFGKSVQKPKYSKDVEGVHTHSYNFIYSAYRKFSIKGAPLFFDIKSLDSWTFLAIPEPKMVRFPFCKKPLEGANVLYPIRVPPNVLHQLPVPLLSPPVQFAR